MKKVIFMTAIVAVLALSSCSKGNITQADMLNLDTTLMPADTVNVLSALPVSGYGLQGTKCGKLLLLSNGVKIFRNLGGVSDDFIKLPIHDFAFAERGHSLIVAKNNETYILLKNLTIEAEIKK